MSVRKQGRSSGKGKRTTGSGVGTIAGRLSQSQPLPFHKEGPSIAEEPEPPCQRRKTVGREESGNLSSNKRNVEKEKITQEKTLKRKRHLTSATAQ